MKTLKILSPIFFIALLFFSCKKEQQIMKGRLPNENNSLNALRIDDRDMTDSMNTFITQTLQGSTSFHSYEAEDALLVMEAALNFHTGHPDSDYYELTKDTLNFSLSLSRNTLTGEYMYSGLNMNSFWPIILDSAKYAKNRVRFDSIHAPFNIVVDLEFTNFSPDDTNSTQTVTLRVVTWVANTPFIGINCSYTVDWLADGPFTGYGCNGNASTTSWAYKEIQRRLSPLCREMPSCDYVSNVWGGLIEPFYNYSATGCTDCFTVAYPSSHHSCIWQAPNDLCMKYNTDLPCETAGIQCVAKFPIINTPNVIMAYHVIAHQNQGSPFYMYHTCDVIYGHCVPYQH
ncbi:MAG: hypothetical protein ABI855_10190 [Bacteroidota bacterium]